LTISYDFDKHYPFIIPMNSAGAIPLLPNVLLQPERRTLATVKRAKRPRPAKRRTLPPDEKSLITMIRSVHEHLVKRAEHLKKEPHDARARRGVQFLHDQRSDAWNALFGISPQTALALAAELGVSLPAQESSATEEAS
jgi:hypothetical protein